ELGRSFFWWRAVSLPRSNLIRAVHAHLDASVRVVADALGRWVSEKILLRQLLEQIVEGVVQLIDTVGVQCAAAGRSGKPVQHPLERLDRDAPALSAHIQGDVARLQPSLDR